MNGRRCRAISECPPPSAALAGLGRQTVADIRLCSKAIKFYLNWMFYKKVFPKDIVALVAEYAKVEFEQV